MPVLVEMSREQPMTPAYFAMFEAHSPEVVNEHWNDLFVPMLHREECLYDMSVGHYYMHIRNNRFTKRHSTEVYPVVYSQLTNKHNLDQLERQALNYIAIEYWDILADFWKTADGDGQLTANPKREAATEAWVQKKEAQIKAKLTQLYAFFERSEA
jgi:hypothetical protein